MTTINRSLDLLSKEQKQTAINDIIDFFATERDEKIGVIAAEALLDMFMETAGKALYNKGVDDTKAFVSTRMEELSFDIESSIKKG